jgi:hypothetical protein
MSTAVAAALRPVPRTAIRRLLTVAAVAAALASVPAITPAGAAEHGASHETMAPALSAKALALHDAMRKLWEDHITWTRLAIVSFAQGSPDLPQTEARLMRNQSDIGTAIKPYYGRRAGDALTALLKQHISGAVDVLAAAKAGDATRLAAARTAWYANGNQIAAFLNHANPHHWRLRAMRTMMRLHLDETLDEAVARLQGRFDADIRAYDRVHHHILAMADMLTDGIVAQFPGRF